MKVRQRPSIREARATGRMPSRYLEHNLDYILGLMNRNKNRNYSSKGMLIDPIQFHTQVGPINPCQNSSPGCRHWKTWVSTQKTE